MSRRRASRVFITDKGGEEIERARAVINRVNEQIKGDFTQSEVEVFKKILKSFFVRFGANP
jgi:DNA-binding MarR family transcriptional regulator